MPISNAIKRKNGKLAKTGEMSIFKAQVQGTECSIDSSGKSDDSMSIIFPDNVYIRIDFINVKPKKKIYIDSVVIASTDSTGQKLGQIIYWIPRNHRIELKSTEKVVEVAEIQIKNSSVVRCEGKNKMICSVVSLRE